MERIIPSYGRKRSRGLSDRQKSSLIDLYGAYGIELPSEKINPAHLFEGKFNKIAIEIGFGHGEHLINQAKIEQNIGFIGCEPFENGVAITLQEIYENKLNNVLIYKGDARLLLKMFEENTLLKTYVLFPDPWSKKRHHKRRLLSSEFIAELRSKMIAPGGSIMIATDSTDYIVSVLDNLKTISNISYCAESEKLTIRPSWFSGTKYERKALDSCKQCYYLKVDL